MSRQTDVVSVRVTGSPKTVEAMVRRLEQVAEVLDRSRPLPRRDGNGVSVHVRARIADGLPDHS